MELLRLTLTDSFKFNSINGFREIEMKLSVFCYGQAAKQHKAIKKPEKSLQGKTLKFIDMGHKLFSSLSQTSMNCMSKSNVEHATRAKKKALEKHEDATYTMYDNW